MYSKITSFTFAALLLSVASVIRAADAPNAGEARLRESLRAVTLQLRSAQTDLAAVQASQAALVEEKRALADQLAALQKRSATDKGLADKSTADLKAKIASQDETIAKYRETLEKTKVDLQKATDTARAAEANAETVTAENIKLERRAADRERKNLALFILANQILSKYEDFSLGKAIAAKEPFLGKTRVKLESLMQDYQDKIDEQRATP